MWNQGGGCFMGFGQWFSGHWIGWFGLNMIIVVALILLLYKLFHSRTTTSPENRDSRDSLAILERRLVEGKVSQEEYQSIRNILYR
jgi:uncharacterized membrane protein